MPGDPLHVVLDGCCLVDARRDAGIGRYARQLADALHEVAGLEVTIARPGCPPLSESRPSRFLHAHPPALRTAWRVRPRLVHGLAGDPLIGWPLRRQVVTVHDVQMWTGSHPRGVRGAGLRLHGALLARLLRACGGLIAVSEVTADEAASSLGIERERFRVVPHGVSPLFSPAASPGDADVVAGAGLAGTPYLLWTGSLRHHDPRKGLDTLLEAVRRLGTDAPRLALVGALGEESDRVTRRARELGVDAVLCGSRDDAALAALHRRAAATVLASRHEGFGLPALEAMACGSAVVATRAGNLPSVTGDAALLVDSGDPVQLAGALRRVLDSPELARHLAGAGRRRAAEFTWQRCAELTVGVYREVAAAHRT